MYFNYFSGIIDLVLRVLFMVLPDFRLSFLIAVIQNYSCYNPYLDQKEGTQSYSNN